MLSKKSVHGIGFNPQEKAYMLDQVSGSSFYADQFGSLAEEQERKLIVSIFLKLQNL